MAFWNPKDTFKVNDLHWASLGYLPSRLCSILYKTLSINGAWIPFDFYHVMDYRIIRCNNFPFSDRKYPLHVVHHNKRLIFIIIIIILITPCKQHDLSAEKWDFKYDHVVCCAYAFLPMFSGILGNWDIGFWDLCDVIPIWRNKCVHMVSNIILYYTLDFNKFFLNFKPHV